MRFGRGLLSFAGFMKFGFACAELAKLKNGLGANFTK